ncbi:MAG: S46 family peptidase [candidate division KSB1 bacterium]|nr:S46 family peptidase [candidate division KSB1 bacterium]MDZ7301585.1 S46 family peptidase [candidate division KSB1 bacterium]MDZ7310999.1 S46 family peptidase [candidate division KSB1 bacterium]
MQSSLRRSRLVIVLFAVICTLAFIGAAMPDEGMWTFDNPPLKQLKEKYGFEPTPEWLDHVRLSSVRFNDGGSGSFVSPRGLVLTNHHVALGQLQKVSTPQKNYVADGFFAKTAAEELKCPDLELNVLMSMENVTARVLAVVKPGMDDKAALEARKAEIAKIEKKSLEATGLRSDVVTLYQGGEYWLYRYKKYTDIRLVFAPEQQIAFYGGDPDNFTYPRHDLDMALFRVYENDKPVESKHYLKWSAKGAADGELVFVSGHPGSTNRLSTVAQLEMQRDYFYPLNLQALKRRLEVLRRYSALGPEEARQAARQIFGIENSIKAITGEYNGLLDNKIFEKKQKEESDFRAQVASKPELEKEYGQAWDMIAVAQKKQLEMLKPLRFRSLRGSSMASNALTIVRYVAEVKKPDGQRLDGFHDSQLESLKFRLFSPAPVYPQLEEMMLTDGLQESLDELGPNDPFIQAVLNGRSPAEVAKELITGTKMGDPAFRKSLVEGGEAAVAASTDPMIVVARKIDPIGRELRKWVEDNVESVATTASEKIGKARFAVYGKSVNPDATFTLRLSYGVVKGYPMNGTKAPSKTTFYGLYDRYYSFDMQPPFHLPQRYVERKDKLDLSTPLNFVTTNDIIGGNSGSPVINKNAELVGLVFDGNIESLVGRFVYNEENNRCVAVHSAAMIEALRKLYDAGALADELQGIR